MAIKGRVLLGRITALLKSYDIYLSLVTVPTCFVRVRNFKTELYHGMIFSSDIYIFAMESFPLLGCF